MAQTDIKAVVEAALRYEFIAGFYTAASSVQPPSGKELHQELAHFQELAVNPLVTSIADYRGRRTLRDTDFDQVGTFIRNSLGSYRGEFKGKEMRIFAPDSIEFVIVRILTALRGFSVNAAHMSHDLEVQMTAEYDRATPIAKGKVAGVRLASLSGATPPPLDAAAAITSPRTARLSSLAVPADPIPTPMRRSLPVDLAMTPPEVSPLASSPVVALRRMSDAGELLPVPQPRGRPRKGSNASALTVTGDQPVDYLNVEAAAEEAAARRVRRQDSVSEDSRRSSASTAESGSTAAAVSEIKRLEEEIGKMRRELELSRIAEDSSHRRVDLLQRENAELRERLQSHADSVRDAQRAAAAAEKDSAQLASHLDMLRRDSSRSLSSGTVDGVGLQASVAQLEARRIAAEQAEASARQQTQMLQSLIVKQVTALARQREELQNTNDALAAAKAALRKAESEILPKKALQSSVSKPLASPRR